MVPWICAFCGLSFQLSLEVIRAPLGPCNSISGSFRTLAAGTPALTREGPRPRSTTGLDAFPRMIKPPIITLSPVSTRKRVEIFRAWAGVTVGEAVGVAVGVAVAVGVGVGVGALTV